MSVNFHLLIISRYPEIGRTKTRLIPLLGAAGAANLHKILTETTINLVKTFWLSFQPQNEAVTATSAVYFLGGNPELMRQWLGAELAYYPQIEGDLGQKMQQAVTHSFEQKANRVVVIGTDCPTLTVAILTEAFNILADYDVVIGPAEDGGYYLIGLSRAIAEPFMNIDWGTERVFAQTVAALTTKNYKIHYLPMLRDIDRPEDYLHWQRAKSQF
ncbi:MAG: TIGR04282 family arsenosugar biosynthesis glycosyltransferase [Microcystaceae cyanobacterium]